jgi:hypothetical protein
LADEKIKRVWLRSILRHRRSPDGEKLTAESC